MKSGEKIQRESSPRAIVAMMLISLWCTTALLAGTLILLSRRHPVALWIALAYARALSVVGAFGTFGVFGA
jgi:hypothetical protein